MKKLLALLLVAAMAFSVLAACGDDGPTEPQAIPESAPVNTPAPPPPPADDDDEPDEPVVMEVRDVRLASHNAVVEGNSFRIRYELDIQEAAAAAADHGFNVSYASFVANWDAALEVQQLQNSINEGYDFIMVNPVSPTGLDPVIEQALDAGILYINCNNIYISPGAGIINVGSNQFEQGYQTATYAGEILGEGARVIMMAAREGNAASELRQRGFERGIEEQGLVVVHESFHEWNDTLGGELMLEILNSGIQFDGVLVSQGADGILQAYEIANAPLPKFIGYHDSGVFMRQVIDANRDGHVMDFMVLNNSPGVGGTALNIGLHQMLGRVLRDDLFTDIWGPDVWAILLPNSIWFTYNDSWDGNDLDYYYALGESLGTDVPSHWWDFESAGNTFFIP